MTLTYVWTRPTLLMEPLETQEQTLSENIVDPVVAFEEAPEAIMNVYRNPSESNKLGVIYPGRGII